MQIDYRTLNSFLQPRKPVAPVYLLLLLLWSCNPTKEEVSLEAAGLKTLPLRKGVSFPPSKVSAFNVEGSLNVYDALGKGVPSVLYTQDGEQVNRLEFSLQRSPSRSTPEGKSDYQRGRVLPGFRSIGYKLVGQVVIIGRWILPYSEGTQEEALHKLLLGFAENPDVFCYVERHKDLSALTFPRTKDECKNEVARELIVLNEESEESFIAVVGSNGRILYYENGTENWKPYSIQRAVNRELKKLAKTR